VSVSSVAKSEEILPRKALSLLIRATISGCGAGNAGGGSRPPQTPPLCFRLRNAAYVRTPPFVPGAEGWGRSPPQVRTHVRTCIRTYERTYVRTYVRQRGLG
jgi:hypothetical protein